MTITYGATRNAAEALRGMCGGAVHLPGDPGYDASRMPWNVWVSRLNPAAVAYPRTAAEVSQLVIAARAAGLQVTTQATGHNASPLGDLSEVLLIKMSAMTSVEIDPVKGIARVGAGTLWLDVVEAAQACGVTVLHGSSPDVGVLGYSLGGGMGWYARELGLQTNALTAATIVTADGSIVHASATENADLFWAIRGGGGNYGVLTEIEFRTFDFSDAYAGMLVWPWEQAEEVLPVWAAWAVDAPRSVTTSFRILQVPPMPEIPEPFRGRNLVVIDGAVLAGDAQADAILTPLRALHPEMDTFARVPTATLVRLHMDPEGPTPAVSATAILDDLPSAGIDALLAATGPASDSKLAVMELRQLGGALAVPAERAGAVSHIPGQFLAFALSIAATPELGELGEQQTYQAIEALAPWTSGRDYLNFAEASMDTSRGYDEDAWLRLRQVKTDWDPFALFIGNHAIPPLGDD
ncbi:MAG: linked oxidase domain protein [Frankiales bacterium]|nr:linked oxidase domain protein [Frankiales bacterium]